MARTANDGAVRGSGLRQEPSDLRVVASLSRSAAVDADTPVILFVDLASDAPLPEVDVLPIAGAASSPAAQTMFWLEGDALMCACPDCHAPMSVRLWLMIAECWRCGTIIELSQEQEREALRLLQEREQAMRRAQQAGSTEKSNPAAEPRARSTPPAEPTPDKHRPRPQATPTPPSRDRTAPTPAAATPAQRRATLAPPAALPVTELSIIGSTGVWLRDAFRDMPAWLLSLIIHMVLLTLLGILTYGLDDKRSIVISSTVSTFQRVEGEDLNLDPSKDLNFDLPLPDKIDQKDPAQRELLIKADQDARELRIDPKSTDPQLPDLSQVKMAIGKGGTSATPLVARDPRVRVELVKKEGGTTVTEAAVSRGLRWLALNQHKDGRWKLQDLPSASGGQGHIASDTAATSLALLPFLGAGQTHLVGRYKDNVAPGLRFLVQQQKPDGDLRGNSQGNSGMYAHGQSAIVLCEAFGMTRDEALKQPAQKAIDFIVAAQHAGGGWRYEPGQPGDTSVVGWQLMALQSARAAGLNVPEASLENADHYLDTVSSQEQSRYAYIRGSGPTNVMTAEALLCRIYLGWKRDEPGLGEGVRWLLTEHPPTADKPDTYYWYYATQTMHHYGGPEWEKWNLAMRDVLTATQDKSGPNAGSWAPRDQHSQAGGRIYTTSLAVCTLEIYYRHLPVFRQLKVD
jgi:hypothetical protein